MWKFSSFFCASLWSVIVYFRHIRRYGKTNNQFTIEAGRKCGPGEGVYSFLPLECTSVEIFSEGKFLLSAGLHWAKFYPMLLHTILMAILAHTYSIELAEAHASTNISNSAFTLGSSKLGPGLQNLLCILAVQVYWGHSGNWAGQVAIDITKAWSRGPVI